MKVILRVVSQKGVCQINHKPGDEIIITESRIVGKICLHALYSILPKAFAVLYGAKFPWLKDGQLPTHACPDSKNPVVFEIERVE
jgi:uncharacterized repeat protein (TIGR04076 family)